MANTEEHSMTTNIFDNIDEDLYDRQIYVLGKEAMHQLMNARVLILGLGGLGVEIAKNIILCGVQSVHIQDHHKITYADLSSQYYFTEADIGQNRAEVAHTKLIELNNYVRISYSSEPLDKSFITLCNIDIVVLTDALHNEQIMLGDYCHKNQIKLIIANTKGLFGQIFCDFGEHFQVFDVDGEKPQTHFVTDISHDGRGIVSILDYERHNLSDDSYVSFSGVKGMTEVNGKEFPITITNPFKFSIGDTTNFGLYENGGTVTEVKKPQIIHFESFDDAILKPSLLIYDYSKMTMPAHLHLAFQALSAYKEKYKSDPKPWNEIDANKFYELTCEINEKMIDRLTTDELNKHWIKLFSKICTGDLCPMQSIIGGIAAQETIKAITGKFMPIKQFLYFDAIECLTDDEKFASEVSRYYSQEIIFGQDFQHQLGQLKYFLAGCGAIGCEILKNFAMMGIGCEKDGAVFMADTDSIERSDLSRHFLFRSDDIGNKKSTTVARAVKGINPKINIHAFVDSVESKNDHIYNENFFQQVDGIVVALKNPRARKFIDQSCVYHQKPVINLGTLGIKANVQVIVPFLTESYYSTGDDSAEMSTPIDVICNFPHRIEHTIQWAHGKFLELFGAIPEQVPIKQRLDENRPKTFSDCIQWAREQFEELFHNNIVQLLSYFPSDYVTHAGERFWTKHRIYPHALQFDSSNSMHVDFIHAASNLMAYVYAIPQVTDRLLKSNALCDDSNVQLDYIVTIANLRAQNYDLGNVDRSEVKRIVRGITPTIVTTTAIVAGLASLEVYKIVQKHQNIEYFRNSFFNMGLSLFAFFEPMPAKRQLYLGHEFTLWDRFEVQGHLTLEEFIDYFKKEYQLVPTILYIGEYLIYSQVSIHQQFLSEDMKRNILELYERLAKTIIRTHLRSFMIKMECEDLQGNEIGAVPYVKYTFR